MHVNAQRSAFLCALTVATNIMGGGEDEDKKRGIGTVERDVESSPIPQHSTFPPYAPFREKGRVGVEE